MKHHQKVWSTTAVPRMASVSGTALLRCMYRGAAEPQQNPGLKLCSQLARVRVKPRVCAYFCWLLGRHAYGYAPKWKFQHVGIFSAYQARTSVHASHFDWRGPKISTRRCRTTRIAVFCESLSARMGAHEPQAYRVHAPVVNTALGCVNMRIFNPG